MIESSFLNQWRATADNVLSVLIAEEIVERGSRVRYDSVAYDIGLSDTAFPPKGGQIATWRAISNLRQEGKPVHQSTILSNPYGANIQAEWLATIITQYSEALDGEVFRANAEALKTFGERYLTMKSLDFAQQDLYANVKDPEAIIHALMSSLAQRGSGQIENEGIGADAFFDRFNMPPMRRLLTRIAPLDRWTGGMTKGMVMGVLSPYKGRKTSLMLNVILNLVESGASASILMLESTQEFLKCQIASLLAMRWLIQNGLYHSADHYGLPMHIGLSAKDIFDANNQYLTWHPTRQTALREAFAQMRKYGDKLRIYSTGHKAGKLSNLASCERVLMYDLRRYKTDIAAIDHVQRISAYGNIFERMSLISNALESFARREGVALLLLSQMNEEGIKAETQGNSPNVKGGGDLSAAVDYMVSLTYDPPEDEKEKAYLRMNMRLSRYGAGGKLVSADMEIERTSGLLLSERRFDLPI